VVKKLLLLAASAAFCLAASVVDIAGGLLGQNSAKATQLFGDGSAYLNANGKPDIAKISNVLKSNSLLRLSYKQNVKVNIKFISRQNNPLLIMKIAKDALNGLGYNNILTSEFSNAGGALWGVTIDTKFIPDPGSLYAALKESGTEITDINRPGELSYEYVIDASNSSINQTPVQFSQEVQLSKPLEPYLIDISGAKSATISASAEDRWSAVVRILDKNLNLIDEKQTSKAVNSLKVSLPQNAKYIMIDDAVSLENIKRGLKIYLE